MHFDGPIYEMGNPAALFCYNPAAKLFFSRCEYFLAPIYAFWLVWSLNVELCD